MHDVGSERSRGHHRNYSVKEEGRKDVRRGELSGRTERWKNPLY